MPLMVAPVDGRREVPLEHNSMTMLQLAKQGQLVPLLLLCCPVIKKGALTQSMKGEAVLSSTKSTLSQSKEGAAVPSSKKYSPTQSKEGEAVPSSKKNHPLNPRKLSRR
jgi:hypothetical protein